MLLERAMDFGNGGGDRGVPEGLPGGGEARAVLGGIAGVFQISNGRHFARQREWGDLGLAGAGGR